jgi:hypothetical protein
MHATHTLTNTYTRPVKSLMNRGNLGEMPSVHEESDEIDFERDHDEDDLTETVSMRPLNAGAGAKVANKAVKASSPQAYA